MFLSSASDEKTSVNGDDETKSSTGGNNDPEKHTTVLFATANLQAVAHEQGHDVGLPHIFCHLEPDEKDTKSCMDLIWNGGVDRKMTQGSAVYNFMDYIVGEETRNMFFKYQMENSNQSNDQTP